MTSEADTSPIVLKLVDEAPDQPKERVNIFLSKRTADALRRTARLKGVGQSDIINDLLIQYFETMVKAKDGGSGP